jgi:voltage-gated potassium channel
MSMRRKAYLQLFESSRPGGAISVTNRCIIAIILLSVAFSIVATDPSLAEDYRRQIILIEMAIGLIFLIEYCTRLWAVAEHEGEGGDWAKRWNYARSPLALIDLIVVIASLLPFLVTSAAILRLLRLVRLAALMKFGRFSSSLRELGKALAERRYDLYVTFALALALLVFGATALHWVEGKVQPEAFGSIPRAMWWSIITLTTVGYGDVSPITPLGKFLASLVAICGIGLVAMPTGIIAAAFSDAMQRQRDAAKK